LEETYGTSLQREIEVAQAAGITALGNIASRVLGLAREMVKSGLFGAGPHVDALNVALRIPNTIFDLLVGGMISSALVPVLSDYDAPERRAELWNLLSTLLGFVSLIVCAFALAGELLAPQLIWLSAGGLKPADQALAVSLLRLMLPGVLCLSLASILTGALYALKRFTRPAFAPAIFNAAMVVVAWAMGRRWGVYSMAAGLLVGAALQVVLQLPGLRGAHLRFALNLRHPALRRIGRLYLPILIGLVVDNLLSVFLSYNLASAIGSSRISWMEYAATIIQVPLGLVVTAVSIAILPTLSRQASADAVGPFRATLAKGLRLVLALVIPATVGLYVLANPIVALILEHGVFAATDTVAVSEALKCALPGLLFAAVDQPLIFAFYARKDTLSPALVGVWTTLIYAATALGLQWIGILNLPLLVLVNSLKLTAHALAMLFLTRRRLGGLGQHGMWPLILKATVASLVMAAVTYGAMQGLLVVAPPGLLGEMLVVGGAGGAGVVAYGLLALALKVEELHLLRAAVEDGLERLTAPVR
jgi:putative peptidoglycan lipid II flippase